MMIHFFSANLKNEKKNIYSEFIKTLVFVLPCEECRKHLRNNLKILPLDFKGDTFEWSCNLHNLVNTQLKKPTYKLCKSIFYKYLDNYNSTYDYIQ